MMSFSCSARLRARSHEIIPGGAHTYAKGDDQFPERAPGFVARGRGCHVWDVDGNEFIEYGMGLRAVTLGHAHPAVIEAAARALQDGVNFTRPSPFEVECAEQLLRMIPAADMVKFAKNGSDVTTAAVKLARAHTGRDMVAICAEHPFFSCDDWFIGTTPMAAGIPEAIGRLTVKFHYNALDTLQNVFDRHPGRLACVVMEAERNVPPAPGFLHAVQALCRQQGALFVLDEIITGFRWSNGGAQAVYGLQPDLSTFGKGMGNGFAIAALAGKRSIMELGGMCHDRERVFLLSTTNGAETHALAAARQTMQIYESEPVVEVLRRQGERLAAGITQVARARGVHDFVAVEGHPANLTYVTRDADRQPSQAFRTLLLQELIARGVIAPSLVVSYAHTDEDIDQTIEAMAGALDVYARALAEGVEGFVVGPFVQPVMRPYARREAR